MVGGGLEQAVRGGSVRLERNNGGGGAAEGTGKEVRGAPGVGAELGSVTGSLEGDRWHFLAAQ
jgi:hypothetical protein